VNRVEILFTSTTGALVVVAKGRRAAQTKHVDVEEADSLLGFHPTSGGVWIFIP
jgi:hypothetical protein